MREGSRRGVDGGGQARSGARSGSERLPSAELLHSRLPPCRPHPHHRPPLQHGMGAGWARVTRHAKAGGSPGSLARSGATGCPPRACRLLHPLLSSGSLPAISSMKAEARKRLRPALPSSSCMPLPTGSALSQRQALCPC